MPITCNGIYCIEAEWESDFRKRYTMEHILQLVQEADKSNVDFILRTAATGPSLLFYLRKWCDAAYAKYPILYLSMHGEPGKFLMENWKRKVKLGDLLDVLRGQCRGRVLYISACEVLKKVDLREILKETGALAVIGYRHGIEWTPGCIVDYLVLCALARGKLMPRTRLKQRVLDRVKGVIHPRILKEYGFCMEVS